jgi:thioredoxin 1
MKELVEFGAQWCGPCRTMEPIFERLSKKYSSISFRKVDVDKQPELASEYGVMSLPTFMFIQDGHPISSIIGAVPESRLEKLLQNT